MSAVPWGTVPTLVAERLLADAGHCYCAGLDEVGRGCLAGPVVAAAVILPLDATVAADLVGVNDSKALSAAQREKLVGIIQARAVAWAIGLADVATIDARNILNATKLAMHDALRQLAITPGALVIDALRLPDITLPQVSLIKGDRRSLSIAAASILAKVARDTLMRDLDTLHPGYGFGQHKGYGTPQHLAALHCLGPCPAHRHTFAPVRALIDPPPQQMSLID